MADCGQPSMESEEDEMEAVEAEPDRGSDSSSSYNSMDSDSDDESLDDQNNDEEEEEEDEDDPVVKAIHLAKDKKDSNCPPPLVMDGDVTDFTLHSELDIIAVSTGSDLQLFKYNNEEHSLLGRKETQDRLDEAFVRQVRYSQDGKRIHVMKSHNELKTFNTETLELEQTINDVTDGSPMRLLVVDENIIAVGDDKGAVKLWDKRKKTKAMSIKVSEDHITGLLCEENKKTLVCCTGDGYVASVKLGAGKVGVKSEQYDSPFNCMGTFRQNSKLAVANTEGQVHFFNSGEFGYHADVYSSGKNNDLVSMVPITEKIGLLGDEHGYIRAVHFYPHKNLGVVGRHKFGAEIMDVCNDGHLIASCDMSNTINFWNVSYLSGFVLPPEQVKKSGKTKTEMKKHNLPSSKEANPASFFDGLKD